MAITIKYIQNTNDLTANMTEVYTWLASNASPLFSSVDLDTSNSKIVLHATDAKNNDVEAVTLYFNKAYSLYILKNSAGLTVNSARSPAAHSDSSGETTTIVRMLAKTENGICIHYGFARSLMISTAMDGGLAIAYMRSTNAGSSTNPSGFGTMHINSTRADTSLFYSEISSSDIKNDSLWGRFSSHRASRMVAVPYVFETSYTGSMYHTVYRNINCPVDLIIVSYKGTEYLYNGVTLLR